MTRVLLRAAGLLMGGGLGAAVVATQAHEPTKARSLGKAAEAQKPPVVGATQLQLLPVLPVAHCHGSDHEAGAQHVGGGGGDDDDDDDCNCHSHGSGADGSEAQAAVPPFVLYQYAPCPFCNKVRTFMDYHRIPYKKVEVEPLRKRQMAFSEYKKVPVLIAGGEQINDSGLILKRLAQYVQANAGPHYQTPTAEEQTWIQWVDDRLVHLLPANIYRTPSESLQSFDYLLNSSFHFSASERVLARYSGAVVMYLLCKFKLNKKYGIQDPRQEIYEDVDSFINALDGSCVRTCSNMHTHAHKHTQTHSHTHANTPSYSRIISRSALYERNLQTRNSRLGCLRR